MIEEWRDIRDLEGYFQVSNLGRIRALDRHIVKVGVNQTIKGRMLKGHKGKNGYIKTNFSKNGVLYYRLIHRLVAEAFIPNPENKKNVNHKNGIKDDNRLENLEWATDSENSLHAIRTGLTRVRKGEEIYFSKITNRQAYFIKCMFFRDNMSVTQISKVTGLSGRMIADLVKERTWKHIVFPNLEIDDEL